MMLALQLLQNLGKVALVLFALRCLVVYTYRLFFHPLRSYPGPFIAKLTDWYGVYYAFHRHFHVITYQNHQKYGRVIRNGPNKLLFNSVDALRDIYLNERLLKAPSYQATQTTPTVFNTFNTPDKRVHRTKRRIIGQGINERAMRLFEPVMQQQVDVFLQNVFKSIEDARPVDITTEGGWLAIDVSCALAFGQPFNLQTSPKNRYVAAAIWKANRRLNTFMQFPVLKHRFDVAMLRFYLPVVFKYYGLMNELIKARLQQEKDAKPDIFSSISSYKDPETGTMLNQTELFSEAAFIIPAGGDTTATLIASTFYYLSRYPNAYRRLASEIRTAFATGADITNSPKLKECIFLRAVIDESLRMNPPVGSALLRTLPKDTRDPVVIDGHVIPPGIQVGVSTYSIHHNPAYFPQPFTYRPERWLPEENGMSAEANKRMHDAFAPFSLGSRSCAGRGMAYMESSLTIAKTIWYFDFQRVDCGGVDEWDGGNMEGGGAKETCYRTGDQFGSSHKGPWLKFRERVDVAKELGVEREKSDW